jgi:hypothetical protein
MDFVVDDHGDTRRRPSAGRPAIRVRVSVEPKRVSVSAHAAIVASGLLISCMIARGQLADGGELLGVGESVLRPRAIRSRSSADRDDVC